MTNEQVLEIKTRKLNMEEKDSVYEDFNCSKSVFASIWNGQRYSSILPKANYCNNKS